MHHELMRHNNRLWKYCQNGKNKSCFKPDFLSAMCMEYPFQSIKTVRMRLNLLRPFLEDDRYDK